MAEFDQEFGSRQVTAAYGQGARAGASLLGLQVMRMTCVPKTVVPPAGFSENDRLFKATRGHPGESAMILYRPVGLEELLLIYRSGMRHFPPRLPDQPIFYPVLNFGYAEQIARDWNTTSGTFAGYVTEFDIDDAYVGGFPVQTVGAREHQELWVPAESLDEFNAEIVGAIRVVAAYFGTAFAGVGKDAAAQFERLGAALRSDRLGDVERDIAANQEAVFAHYPYWVQVAQTSPDARRILTVLHQGWARVFPSRPLGVQRRTRP